jgi:hypothetical protein
MDVLVAEELERLAPRRLGAGPDWRDVLRRAEVRPRRRLRLALAALAVAVAAATPALALSERLREAVGLGHPPGPVLVARLGEGATVRLTAPGVLLAHWKIIVVRRFAHTGRSGGRFLHEVPFHWQLRGSGGSSLVLRRGADGRGAAIATLCAPCADGAAGLVRVPTRISNLLFNRRAAAVLSRHGGTPLRGTVELKRLR